jgi:hypothetical protein
MDNLVNKYIDFDYINLWMAELYYLKANIAIINCANLQVKMPIKGRYDKIKLMNL